MQDTLSETKNFKQPEDASRAETPFLLVEEPSVSRAQQGLAQRPTMSIRAKIIMGFFVLFILCAGASITFLILGGLIDQKLKFMETGSSFTFDYHLVINLEHISLDTACEIILSALNQPEFRDSPERQKIVKDFALATRVKVHLATHDRTKGLEFEVEAREGMIRITGSFLTSGIFARGKHTIKHDLLETVMEVDGVKKVEIVATEIAVPLE